jgi:dTDP-4-dehydrorhamnose reductase
MLLVTGGTGQLATALARARPVTVVGRPEFDFDRPETLGATFEAVQPSLVINAAAYTAVDRAEQEKAAATRANRDGPAALAALCARAGVPLIHISTDYVFDGDKGAPYVETDPTGPTGVYGASKLAGERAVLDSGARAAILRTAWVYGPVGKNFVLTMLGAARKTGQVRVVADQRGCPTATPDLALAVLAVADAMLTGWRDAFGGVFHACGGGETTWHGLAVAVFEEARRHGLPSAEVAAIRTEDWPTPARRPPDSRLDCGKLAQVFGARLPHWRDALTRVVDDVAA